VKKRFRLAGRADFQRLLVERRLYAGASLVGFAAPGRSPGTRVGITASRQIRGSVARNRARRRLREAVRLTLLRDDSFTRAAGISFDVVLIARPPALKVPLSRIEADLDEFLARLPRGC
jgi:ribonuclease P protein component